LDSRRYEIRIHGGSIEVLYGDMAVIRGTRCYDLYKMVGTVESTSLVIPASTHTWRVVGGDDMTGCVGAATVEICHVAISAITQLRGQRVARGGRLSQQDFLRCLGTDWGRNGYAVGDLVWGIGCVFMGHGLRFDVVCL
jgi:hypothetical protein